jgi:hypothetical protein
MSQFRIKISDKCTGQVVSVTPNGLRCSFSQCPPGSNTYPPDGQCYQLGTRGPCQSSQLFGFDILRSRAVCVDVTSVQSPYAEPVDVDPVDVSSNIIRRSESGVSEPLLVPCRPGARQDNNFKCTNLLVLVKFNYDF